MNTHAIDDLVRLADNRMSRGDDAGAVQALSNAIKILQENTGELSSARSRLVELNRLRRVLEYLETRVAMSEAVRREA